MKCTAHAGGLVIVIHSLSGVQLLVTPWTTVCQDSSLSPWVFSNSCRLSQWCHPTFSYSIIPFSFCLPSFPASGSFPMSRLFASSGQSIGASASALVLPMNIQGWFPLGLAGFISGGLCTLYIWDQQTIFPKTNLACCMLSCGPQTKNGFYIFKWLKRIKTKIIFQDKKIIWNSNFSVHIQVLLVHSLAFIYM